MPIQGDKGNHRTGRLSGAGEEGAGADKLGRPGEMEGRNRLGAGKNKRTGKLEPGTENLED